MLYDIINLPLCHYYDIFNLPFYILCTIGLDAGAVGLGLAYTISLAALFQYCVRMSAEVENIVSEQLNQQ